MPQRVQKLFGAANRDLLVERIRLAGKIEIGREMDHRSDPGAIGRPHALQAGGQSFVRCQVDADTLCSRRGLTGRRSIEADEGKPTGEAIDESRADEAGATGHDHRIALFRHSNSLLLARATAGACSVFMAC